MASRRRLLLLATLGAIAWIGWMARERAPGHATQSAHTPAKSHRFAASASVAARPASPWIAPPDSAIATAESPAQRTTRFRRMHQCYSAWNRVTEWSRYQESCRSIVHYGASATMESSCQAGLEQARPQMQASRGELSGCPDAATVAGRAYEAARDAAAAGDTDAQACYLLDFFDNPDRSPRVRSRQEIADYERIAPRYLSDGLARGDWRTVALLAMDFVDGNTLLPYVASQKPMDKYVMNRLLQLGADGQYAATLDRTIRAMFLTPGLDAPPALAPRQAAEGDARARALYRRYFASSPRLQAEPIPCPSD